MRLAKSATIIIHPMSTQDYSLRSE